MSYVRRTLAPNERLLFMTGYHWLVWLEAAALTAPAVAVGIGGYPYSAVEYIYLLLSLIALPFGLMYFGRAVSTEIAVTTDRFVRKTGIVSFDTEELSLDKIETVVVEQTILGRLLAYGTFRMHGTGQGSIEVRQSCIIRNRMRTAMEPLAHICVVYGIRRNVESTPCVGDGSCLWAN